MGSDLEFAKGYLRSMSERLTVLIGHWPPLSGLRISTIVDKQSYVSVEQFAISTKEHVKAQ